MPASLASQYAVVVVTLVLAVVIGLLAIVPGRGRRTRRDPTPPSLPAPQFGARSGHKSWVQFRVRYAVLALVFVAFDMEMVFMFPWAVAFRQMGMVALMDMFVFIAILTSAIVFAWKSGAFTWER